MITGSSPHDKSANEEGPRPVDLDVSDDLVDMGNLRNLLT